MRTPQPGDLIIRNTSNERFDIVNTDGQHVAGPFETFLAAHLRALIESKGGVVWQQALSGGGQAVGEPAVVPPLR
jgi:hypothetical protein